MKKIAALVVLVVMLFTSAALADDLSSLSDAELINLGREVLDELERRQAGSREEAFSPVQVDTDEAHPALPQLVLFFDYWSRNQYDEMLGFCLPEWKEQCENPLFELFKILANRTPKSLSPEKISLSDPEGTVCTVTATAEIDRNNGTAPALYRLQIRMAKGADGLWYVDPESLLTYETAEETPLPEPTPDPAVTEPFDDSAETVLYYNPSGSEYYHRDPNCRSVNPKFQPLAGTFRFSELSDEPYVHLNPCNVCGAPLRPEP